MLAFRRHNPESGLIEDAILVLEIGLWREFPEGTGPFRMDHEQSGSYEMAWAHLTRLS
jgi:hypothetical protein